MSDTHESNAATSEAGAGVELRTAGIHHVTAITADARENLRFYTQALGLRLVKRTVNFDDPTSHHLYYGNGVGQPGTVITFFAWPGAARGRKGAGETIAVAFSVPVGSLGYWADRLSRHGAKVEQLPPRFGQELIEFEDPDGIQLELIEAADDREPWSTGPVSAGKAIHGFHSITLSQHTSEPTARLLTEHMGCRLTMTTDGRQRFAAGVGGPGSWVDVVIDAESSRPRLGAGSIHHVAWRAPDEPTQASWRRRLLDLEFNVSPVMDRCYFRSIYFREPGGVLFEIATDGPGFGADEPLDQLGQSLKLPPNLEPIRGQIEGVLPPLS